MLEFRSQERERQGSTSTSKGADRRVRRTRESLRAALFSLIIEKGYDSITVQEILDRAGVGRATFYNHFTDKEHVLRSGFEWLRQHFTERSKRGDSKNKPFGFSLDLYRRCHEPNMRRLWDAISKDSAGSVVIRWLAGLVEDLARPEIDSFYADSPPRFHVDALVHFVGSTFISLLRWSIGAKPAPAPETLDVMFRGLVMPALCAARR